MENLRVLTKQEIQEYKFPNVSDNISIMDENSHEIDSIIINYYQDKLTDFIYIQFRDIDSDEILIKDIEEILVQCDSCDENQQIEVQKECGQSMSMCCGGCSEMIDCNECDGSGFVNIQI